MEYPSFYNGIWYLWKPLPGLDPSLGESSMWLAALHYSIAKANGKSETECHSEAEKAAYSQHYRVGYNDGNIIIARDIQKNKNP
jgi:hypothetical protein